MSTPRSVGVPLGVGAYVLWGFLPLYLKELAPLGAVEVIAHRIVWSLVICAVLLVALGQLPDLKAVLARPRQLGALAFSGVLLSINWLVFVYATLSGQVLEAALGYFLNPLVSVGLGVFALGERLRPTQWVAIGVASSAVVVITAGLGRLPWIALTLAITFGCYGFIEKRVGKSVPVVTALSVETATVAPFAIGYLIYLGTQQSGHFLGYGPLHAALVVGVGVATVAPLLLFNGAARRLPLSTLGFLQYLCPVLQFLTAWLVFAEPMGFTRWFGFAAVWAALLIFSVDSVLARRSTGVAEEKADAASKRA